MLSSSVQSGSALVAIVGGILGSRYVALDAEQRTAQRRLVEVRTTLAAARKAERAAAEEWAAVSAAGGDGDPAMRAATVNRIRSAHDDAVRTVLRLEGERTAAQRILTRTRRPAGFGLALQVLAYIALSSILIPLAMMVWEPEHLPLGARLVVGVGFGSGVVLLFRYLFVYAAVLGSHSERTVMPGNVLGLLAPTRRKESLSAR